MSKKKKFDVELTIEAEATTPTAAVDEFIGVVNRSGLGNLTFLVHDLDDGGAKRTGETVWVEQGKAYKELPER